MFCSLTKVVGHFTPSKNTQIMETKPNSFKIKQPYIHILVLLSNLKGSIKKNLQACGSSEQSVAAAHGNSLQVCYS